MITFRGGVHPYDGKEYTKDKQIEKLEIEIVNRRRYGRIHLVFLEK